DVKNLSVMKDNKPFKTVHIATFDPVAGKMVIKTCDLRTKKIRTETLVTDPDLGNGKRQIIETTLK
ncbi:MAG TPA: hypothetical protein VK155_12885, partial [Bacteroidales bacterium]|nr:hypothetical protein [Bacteroidales bacterium]